MSSLLERLSERLNAAATASAPPSHEDSGAELAGRAGEEEVIAHLRAACCGLPGVSSLSLFQGVRLPDPVSRGHKEIDVVAVSHRGICAIEVKAWSGEVEADDRGVDGSGSAWRQYRRGDGGVVVHESPLELLQRKAQLLHDFLVDRGVAVRGIDFKLVMPNPRLRLGNSVRTSALASHLVTHEGCGAFFGSFRETVAERLQALVLPTWVAPAGTLSLQQLADVERAIGRAGTWDKLRLHGGAVRMGDFRSVDGLGAVDRSAVAELRCVHTRSSTMAVGWAVLGFAPAVSVECVGGRQGGTESNGSSWSVARLLRGVGMAAPAPVLRRVQLPLDACVRFQPAGASEVVTFSLNEVEGLELSTSLKTATRHRSRSRSRGSRGAGATHRHTGMARVRSPSPAGALSGWIFV
eukprot:COSAG01_NODE_1784_length_9237_cov_11.706829_2_plen_409_part_00